VADKLFGGFEGGVAWGPAGWADLTRVLAYITIGLEFAQKLLGVAAYFVIGDFGAEEATLGVKDEGSAQGEAGFWVIDS
jgi:hypothetical protein